MKTLIAALSLAALAGPALAVDFTGPYAPANWTVSTLGTLTGSPTAGSATFTPTQLTLVGGNSSGGCTGGTYGFLTSPCQIQATIGIPGTYSFHWAYTTADADGPAGDIFGALVDGVRTQLSDPGGAISQSGDRTFNAASSFGWFVNCTDCTGGSATAIVSQFAIAQAVPEPSTYALLLGGMAALGVAARRKRGGARIRG
jgi:hypothetical protein